MKIQELSSVGVGEIAIYRITATCVYCEFVFHAASTVDDQCEPTIVFRHHRVNANPRMFDLNVSARQCECCVFRDKRVLKVRIVAGVSEESPTASKKSKEQNDCDKYAFHLVRQDNVRVIPDAGDIETVGADKIAKLSAETSGPRANAAWDQRIVIRRSVSSCSWWRQGFCEGDIHDPARKGV